MKRISVFIVAAIAALAFSSCEKEPIADNSQSTINLNISVAGLDTPETKAGKKAWVNGDKINIYFDSHTVSSDNLGPDLIITYDGSAWTAGELRSSTTLKSTGKLACFYEGNNDLSKYLLQVFSTGESECFYYSGISMGEDESTSPLACPLVARIDDTDYSFDEASNTLSTNLSGWDFNTNFKVLIPTDSSMPGDAVWILQVKNLNAEYPKNFPAQPGGIVPILNNGTVYMGTTSGNYYGLAMGIKESDGIAFYYFTKPFTTNNFLIEETDVIQFELRNGVDGTPIVYTKEAPSVTFSNSYCKGISINYSQFTAPLTADPLSGSEEEW